MNLLKSQSTGLPAILQSLEILNRDRLWVKWGHGRFAQLRRTTAGTWTVHPTRLSISPEDVDKGLHTSDERSQSREFTGEVETLEWLLELSETTEEQGIFFIPAATDADAPLKGAITHTDTISCEIDYGTTAEQLERYEWFARVTGLEYALKLTSGSKSVHAHILLNESVAFEDVERLRNLFVLCLLGDAAVTNRHQPMRAPGFFRKAKGNYQALLSTSSERYSLGDIEQALSTAFADLVWAFPESLSDELWADAKRLLKPKKDAEGAERPLIPSVQRQAIAALLERGNKYYEQQAEQRAERAKVSRAQRAQLEITGQFNLVDAVGQIDSRVSPDQAFGTAHDWKFSGNDKARGTCQWHQSTSNSAWLSRGDKGWAFHCPTCTSDKPVSPFAYWLAERRGVNAAFPVGRDWAELATEYAQSHGVTVPEWKPTAPAVGLSATPGAELSKEEKQAAARLEKKLQADVEKWIAVVSEIEADFTPAGDDAGDIERAREVVLKATAQRVAYDKDVANTGRAFSPEVLDDLLSGDAPKVIGGQTNAGKTELATQATARAIENSSALRYAAIAPTQVLSVQAAERFEGKGAPMESTAIIAEKSASGKKAKAIPAESLYKLKGEHLDMLSCDEPDQWLPRILSGVLGDAADANLMTLKALAESVPNQLWLNADPNPITIDLIEYLSGQKPEVINLKREHSNKPVSVSLYKDGLAESGNVLNGSGGAYSDFERDALAGKRTVLFAASTKKARALRKRIQKAGIPVLFKDGKYTPKQQRLGFAMAPEKAMQTYNVVILTRLVETGLDLQKDFDTVYVALSPKMEARSAYQFLSRSRSLLRGDTTKLGLYIPDLNFVGIDQLSVSYHADRIRSQNKFYLSLLKGDTSAAEQKLEKLDKAIEFSARYKADAARQTFFREELLTAKIAELGWTIESTIQPAPGERAQILSEIDQEIYKADRLEAHCTARGKRSINEYSEAYASKLVDQNEQGLILDCKRRKLELSGLLPDSDLENVDLIYRLQQDDRILPQALLLSAIALNPHSDRIQGLLNSLNEMHLDKINLYGPMQGLKELRSSRYMLTLEIAGIIHDSPLVQRVLTGDDGIHYGMDDVREFAALLKGNEQPLNEWCSRYFGRDFSWDEDATSVVCKALDKLLGIKSASTGQVSAKIDGKAKRPRVMRTSISEEGRAAIAKVQAKKKETEHDDELAKVIREYQLRTGLIDSARTGWNQKIDEAITFTQRANQVLHTKINTDKMVGIYFSVQAGESADTAKHRPPLTSEPAPLTPAEAEFAALIERMDREDIEATAIAA